MPNIDISFLFGSIHATYSKMDRSCSQETNVEKRLVE